MSCIYNTEPILIYLFICFSVLASNFHDITQSIADQAVSEERNSINHESIQPVGNYAEERNIDARYSTELKSNEVEMNAIEGIIGANLCISVPLVDEQITQFIDFFLI